MNENIICATKGPRHHLFGFHDIPAFNRTGDKLLSLEVEDITRPPLPGEKIGVGYSLWQEQRFVQLGTTNAFNYPQGARQQWLNDTQFIVNNQIKDHWGADIYDVSTGKQIDLLDNPIHCITKDSKFGYGINYSRLHRLGGYGYIGIPDQFLEEAMPSDDGIYVTEISRNETKLLVSIKDVAECDPDTSADNGFHHYVTHLVLSPDNKRIAFLHRFFLSDGGIRTRLMTVGVDGKDLRCIACGFLSHFDWRDNENIFIWGRAGSSIDAIRTNPLLSNPVIKPLLGIAKKAARKVLKRSNGMSMNFLMVKDQSEKDIVPFAQGIITADGHPMCCPTNRDICICDTYPDEEKCRDLFLYIFSSNERTNVGRFRMSDERPDTTLFEKYTDGVDKKILSLMSPDLFSFTRSGLHCDLHPRWDYNGEMVAFDSIHEGTRQIYIYKI